MEGILLLSADHCAALSSRLSLQFNQLFIEMLRTSVVLFSPLAFENDQQILKHLSPHVLLTPSHAILLKPHHKLLVKSLDILRLLSAFSFKSLHLSATQIYNRTYEQDICNDCSK